MSKEKTHEEIIAEIASDVREILQDYEVEPKDSGLERALAELVWKQGYDNYADGWNDRGKEHHDK